MEICNLFYDGESVLLKAIERLQKILKGVGYKLCY